MKESYKDEFEQLLPIQILMDFFFFSFSQVIFALTVTGFCVYCCILFC